MQSESVEERYSCKVGWGKKGGGGSASNAIGTANMLMHLDAAQVGIATAGPTYSLTNGF